MRHLFVSSLLLALSGTVAATGNLAVIEAPGPGEGLIVTVDGDTLESDVGFPVEAELVSLTTFENTVFVARYMVAGSNVGAISAFELSSDYLGFSTTVSYNSCVDPTDITATFDATSTSYIIMTCKHNTLVVESSNLKLVQAVPTPTIDGIQIVEPVSAAAAGDYLFIAYQTELVEGERFESKGLLVQYDISSFSIVGSKRIIGSTIYLVASTTRGLLLTSSGFGKSFFSQMQITNLQTVITMRSDGETFGHMSITPDACTLYISYEGSDGTGGIRSIDLTTSRAEQMCTDSPIATSPVGASTVMNGTLYVASANIVTSYPLDLGNLCPLTGSRVSAGTVNITINAITSMCSECAPPLSR